MIIPLGATPIERSCSSKLRYKKKKNNRRDEFFSTFAVLFRNELTVYL